jgi:spoIIIJ-associated protein
MERQFFSGNTIEQAVMAAARHFGIEPERVAYTLRDKKHGFLKVRRRVVIEVDPSAPEKSERQGEADQIALAPPERPRGGEPAYLKELGGTADETPHSVEDPAGSTPPSYAAAEEKAEPRRQEPRARRAPRTDLTEVRAELLREFEERLEDTPEDEKEFVAFELAVEVAADLTGLELEGIVEQVDDVYEVELEGPDADLLLEDDGEAVRAIEHLLPRLVRGLLGYGLPCTVDCEGFQESRDEELREIAEEAAEDVRERGRSRLLEPMNPADRRVVHLTLADDPDVETESEGDGYMKRVRVLPAR